MSRVSVPREPRANINAWFDMPTVREIEAEARERGVATSRCVQEIVREFLEVKNATTAHEASERAPAVQEV